MVVAEEIFGGSAKISRVENWGCQANLCGSSIRRQPPFGRLLSPKLDCQLRALKVLTEAYRARIHLL